MTTRLTYGGKTYDFEPDGMSYPEGVLFQHETRMKIGEYLIGLQSGDITCMVAALWFARYQAGEKSLKFRDVTDDPDLRPLRDIGMEDDEAPEDDAPDPTGASSVKASSAPSPTKPRSAKANSDET